ncbi:MAG: DUF87 domain-containing protein [Melioribacteraceae bacterium]|nr:DUF87 domain-containing protein [Melioribacteraceae bacterium]
MKVERSMMKLNISEDFSLPMDVVTKRLAFLGTTGSGKSYAAMKLAEELLMHGVQTIILDPVGIHWGLRLSADRKGAGIPINVFGGLYGDIPITTASGAMIADVIIDKKVSAVIDTSQFEFDTDKAKFASTFVQRFFFRKKASPSPVMIFLEEAQEFIPQNPEREENIMLHHFIRMCKIGRNFGIGISIISQRPQEVNKKALNLSQCVFAFQTSGHHERKAIDEWVRDKGLDLDIAADLPKLPVGQPHLWSPGWLGISQKVKISKRITFHPSEEETISYEPGKLNKLSPVDIAKLSESIKETIEKAKESDPETLRKRIRDLEKNIVQLEKAGKSEVRNTKDEKIIENGELSKLKLEIKSLRSIIGKQKTEFRNTIKATKNEFDKWIGPHIKNLVGGHTTFNAFIENKFEEAENNLLEHIKSEKETPHEKKVISQKVIHVRPGERPIGIIEQTRRASVDKNFNTTTNLGKGERLVLISIAQHEEGVDREQVGILTGYKRSSRDRYIQRLSQQELCTTEEGKIFITERGREALGNDYNPLPTGEDLREYWLDRLGGGERSIFELVINKYPESISRDEITESVEYKRSSRDRYLQRLAQRKLINTLSGGRIKASDKLF